MVSKQNHFNIKSPKGEIMTRKKATPPSPPPAPACQTKSVSLRLPEKMADLAQQCAQTSGLSLNGLICSALADYLAARGYRVHSR
jgi:predicted HicB family RNase H-like nuclease